MNSRKPHRRPLRIAAWAAGGLAAALAITAPIALSDTSGSAPAKDSVVSGGKYVALGSSFAAGPGLTPYEPGTAGTACSRSQRNYANLTAHQLGLALTDVTCAGATTDNILHTQQNGQPPQINAVTGDTSLVTVTVGGNDVDYLPSLVRYSCEQTSGSHCGTVDQARINRELGTVSAKIGAVFAAIHQRAPHARVVAVDYQTVLPRSGPLCAAAPLTSGETDFERGVATSLEAATVKAAQNNGVDLVPAASATQDHNVCASDPWVNAYKNTPGWASYHPTSTGMATVADLVAAKVRG